MRTSTEPFHLAKVFLLLLAGTFVAACQDAARDAAPQRAPEPVVAPPSTSIAAPSPAPTAQPAPAAEPARPAAKGTKEPGDTAPEAFEGTAGVTERKIPEVRSVELQSVRAARHEGFDRVVFEFAGSLPGYRVEYIDKPVRRCGTGDAVEVAGQGWLKVRMTPAQAHDEKGRPTAGKTEPRPGLPILQQLEATCDFEGELSWVLGVAKPNRYRVLELKDPPRLVVDVRH